MENLPTFFVSGTYTGVGDVEINILEKSLERQGPNPKRVFVFARAKHSPETYFFDERFLITKYLTSNKNPMKTDKTTVNKTTENNDPTKPILEMGFKIFKDSSVEGKIKARAEMAIEGDKKAMSDIANAFSLIFSSVQQSVPVFGRPIPDPYFDAINKEFEFQEKK
jgi:hypothetical protein